MSRDDEARLTSNVRSHRRRREPAAHQEPRASRPAPHEATVRLRVSTRYRLERVSLLPFVPAPLLASIERARVRRRTRLILLTLAGLLGTALLFAWASGFVPEPLR